MIRPLTTAIATASLCALATLPLASCGGGDKPSTTGTDHGHDHADGDHDHDHDHAAPGAASTTPGAASTTPGAASTTPGSADTTHGDGHSHGATTELGEQDAGGFKIKASRDGDVKAGTDAAIDVWVNGGKAGSSVRFWIGTEDAKGSVKAKAEVEVDHWHTHAEVPDPLPAGSKLWVEVEGDGGAKTVVSFDLKL